jgi:hypothetical protein
MLVVDPILANAFLIRSAALLVLAVVLVAASARSCWTRLRGGESGGVKKQR